MKLSNLFTVKKVLTYFLLLSVAYSVYAINYKIKYWGFSFSPNENTDVWRIDAKISFKPISNNVKVAFAVPNKNEKFSVLSDEVVANGYKISRDSEGNKVLLEGKNKKGLQTLYYRLNIYEDEKETNFVNDTIHKSKKDILLSEEEKIEMDKIWEISSEQSDGDVVQKIISVINQEMVNPTMSLIIPLNHTPKEYAEKIIKILEYKNIKAHVAWVLKLAESKSAERLDVKLEALVDGNWKLYSLETGKIGLPERFVVFQRGGDSLLDVRGGEKSKVMFSVMKSVATPLKMARYKAKNHGSLVKYEHSIYNLPLLEQNTLKWLMIFPLAILIVVILRNVIGVTTMGTFTPMLLSMSLVKTGFVPGLVCFSIMILLGLLMRTVVAKLNLLLVPRISFVVIFVILLIQMLTVLGYRFDYKIISSAIFFPIIITAWIIERASITWEEEGARNTIKEIFNTLLTAVVTYFIISNEIVRHIMFAFNELNIVIMFIVMLLGTYTGYRLTEITRFSSLTQKDSNNV